MITTSEQTDKLDATLAKVLAMVSGLERSATNPFTKSKYPNLEDTWTVLRPACRDHGLSVTQHPFQAEGNQIGLQTRVAKDGQWIMSEAVMPVQKWDPQGWGAALTYLKRYALSAIFGLAEDDDDGNMASGRGVEAQKTPGRYADDPSPAKAPQRTVKRDDWEIKARCLAEGIPFPDHMGQPEPFLTDAAKAEPNEHGAYVVTMGKNTGKRIDQIGEKGLEDFLKWVEAQKKDKAQIPKSVAEYHRHAMAYLGRS